MAKPNRKQIDTANDMTDQLSEAEYVEVLAEIESYVSSCREAKEEEMWK